MYWGGEGPRDMGLALSYLLQERTVGEGGEGVGFLLKVVCISLSFLSLLAHSASFTNSPLESLLSYTQCTRISLMWGSERLPRFLIPSHCAFMGMVTPQLCHPQRCDFI